MAATGAVGLFSEQEKKEFLFTTPQQHNRTAHINATSERAHLIVNIGFMEYVKTIFLLTPTRCTPQHKNWHKEIHGNKRF